MSTKVYDVYKFDAGITELMPFIHEITETINGEIQKNIENSLKERGITKLSEIIDHCSKVLADTSVYDNTIVVFFDEGNTARARDNRLSQITGDDTKCDIYLNFYGGTLLKYIHDKKDPRLIDYHYQNQTDPWYAYENLEGEELERAEKEYQVRSDTWERIFKDYNMSPIEAGLSYKTKPDDFKIAYEIFKNLNKVPQ